MKISTKKWIYFASTVFGAVITLVGFPGGFLQNLTIYNVEYALFGSYSLYRYVDFFSLLYLFYTPVIILSLIYAHRYFKPYNKMMRISLILNYFFLSSLVYLILTAGLTPV